MEDHGTGGEREVGRQQGFPRQTAGLAALTTVSSAGAEVDELGTRNGEDEHQPFSAHVVGGDGEKSEDDQVAGGR